MKQLHECDRNITGMDMEVYTYDRDKNTRSWYINAHIVFYCPYCGIELRKLP